MALSSKVLALAFLLAFMGFGTWFIGREPRTLQDEREVMDREIES
jgi:hypothetical protein